jgi:hypothetical protein
MPNQNKTSTKTKRSTWTNQVVEEAMEVVEAGTHSQQKTNKLWGIPLTSLSNHLNGKTRS